LALRRISGLGYGSISTKKARITKDDIQDPAYERHVQLGWNYRMSDVVGAVALAQTERMEELVKMRQLSGRILENAMEGCSWLVPQYTPAECEHAYWAVAVRMVNPKITWYDFRKKFMELGGDGIYSAWQLSYLEPAFRLKNFMGREMLMEGYTYEKGLCPVAEILQPQMLQFKTNYFDTDEVEAQAEILKKTIRYFDM
jgi:perosamine synthetase